MSRRLLLVLFVPLMLACTKTYTYQSYEVIRSFGEMATGEDVKIVKRDGDVINGTVVQVDGNVMTVATFDRGREKVRWSEVKVAERVRKAAVVVP